MGAIRLDGCSKHCILSYCLLPTESNVRVKLARLALAPYAYGGSTRWHRHRIRAGVIIDRFQKHFMGELDLTATQIRVGEILLRKVIPDLTHTDLSTTSTRQPGAGGAAGVLRL
jgi:hypothetical protein